MNFKRIYLTVLIISCTVICAAAEIDSSKIKFSGWGYFSFGKVESSGRVSSQFDIDFTNEVLADFDAGIKAVARVGKTGNARFHIGLTTAYATPDYLKVTVEHLRRKFAAYLVDATLEHTVNFGNNTFYTEFGYFPVKYNPQAMNLGEYLFRSIPYPSTVFNGFELADKEKLTGLHAMYKHNFTENNWIKGDLFFSSDMKEYPVHDFTLSYILTGNLANFIEMAGGVSHAHLITVDERKTIPATDTIRFSPKGDLRGVLYVSPNGDTTKYTFKGTKAMARITLDPKAFFEAPILSPADLKIYSEIAVLGWKDYPGWYSDRKERMPFMFGFNFPTFKILDVLAIEGQYWSYPFWNSTEKIWIERSPVPYTGKNTRLNYEEEIKTPKTDDDWRWSIYASKKLFNRIKISGQIASDNISRSYYTPAPPSAFARYTEVMPRTRDWYWMTRVMYYF